MATQTFYASAYAQIGSYTQFTNPTNAYDNDADYAGGTPAKNNRISDYYSFGTQLSDVIPSTATLNTVRIEVGWGGVTGGVANHTNNLQPRASNGGAAIGAGTTISPRTYEYAETLTITPTIAQLRTSTFGTDVHFIRGNSNTDVEYRLQYVRVYVDWTPLASVGNSLNSTWNIRNAVGASQNSTWNIISFVGASQNSTWNISNIVGQSQNATWNIVTIVGNSQDSTWNIRNVVGASQDSTWNIIDVVGSSLNSTWNITNSVGASQSSTWNINNIVGQSQNATWNIISFVGQSLDSTWNIIGAVGASLDSTWNILASLTAVGNSLDSTWNIRNAVGASQNATWNIIGVVGSSLNSTWNIVSELPYHKYWRILVTAVQSSNIVAIAELEFRATIGGADQTTPGGAASASSEYSAGYVDHYAIDNNNATQWASTATALPHWWSYDFGSPVAVAEVLIRVRSDAAWDTQSPKAFSIDGSDDNILWHTYAIVTNETGWTAGEARAYTVSTTDLDESLTKRVTTVYAYTVGINTTRRVTNIYGYSIHGPNERRATTLYAYTVDRVPVAVQVEKTIELKWNDGGSVSKDVDLLWNIFIESQIQFLWDVASQTTKDIQLIWNVSNATRYTSLRWNIVNTVLVETGFKWNIVNDISKSIQFKWDIKADFVKSIELIWGITPEIRVTQGYSESAVTDLSVVVDVTHLAAEVFTATAPPARVTHTEAEVQVYSLPGARVTHLILEVIGPYICPTPEVPPEIPPPPPEIPCIVYPLEVTNEPCEFMRVTDEACPTNTKLVEESHNQIDFTVTEC